jgi:hypothetical protein
MIISNKDFILEYYSRIGNMNIDKDRKIDATPTKEYFIQTITKDVQLIDSILDLIDNSIDSYIENNLKERHKIMISFEKNKFKIEDNCGGIKKNNIYDKVFRFGLPTENRGKTIGVFGIGMKRAVFKMGKNILIESDDGEDNYSVRIDEKWLGDEKNWYLEFESESKTKGKEFTRIQITNLYDNISNEFYNPKFQNILMNRIKDTYSIFIEDNVSIYVNNNEVDHYDFTFLCNDKNFIPLYRIKNYNGVKLELFAGFTPLEKTNNEKMFGWWIFCNNRLVIKNNTTEKTGWAGYNDDERRYHYPEDDRFLGLAFFSSNNSISLPWHTTKEDIQEDSRIYRTAQIEMKAITHRFTNFIRLTGKIKDEETGSAVGKAIFANINLIKRKDIKKESDGLFPVLSGKKIEKILPDFTHISYIEKKKIVKLVKKRLGDEYMTNREMGEKTFNYYADMEEIEND